MVFDALIVKQDKKNLLFFDDQKTKMVIFFLFLETCF